MRPQQYRLQHPLTAEQVEHIDTMFETLFRRVRELDTTADVTTTSTPTATVALTDHCCGSWMRGDDGDSSYFGGPPGVAAAAAAAGATILVQTFSITETQMKTLSTAPITLLSGVSGKRIIPVACITHTLQNVQFGVNITATLRYAAQALDIAGPVNIIFGAVPGTNDYYQNMTPIQTSLANGIVPINSAVVLKGNADTGTGATGTSQITGEFYYFLASV